MALLERASVDGTTGCPTPGPETMLTEMWAAHLELMRQHGIHPDFLAFDRRSRRDELCQTAAVALAREAFEVLDELPWKTWREIKPVVTDNVAEELVDCFHFILQIAILIGMDAEKFYYCFMSKAAVNMKRAQVQVTGIKK